MAKSRPSLIPLVNSPLQTLIGLDGNPTGLTLEGKLLPPRPNRSLRGG